MLSKRFIIRLTGFIIILADIFFILYIWHSAALAMYTVSSISISVGGLGASIQSNGAEYSYTAAIPTIDSLSEAFEFMGGCAVWVYIILILGLMLCVMPHWFVKLFDWGAAKTAPSDSKHQLSQHDSTNANL